MRRTPRTTGEADLDLDRPDPAQVEAATGLSCPLLAIPFSWGYSSIVQRLF
ncbi:MAG: hypothetical protein LBG24_09685 [Treponema sp.]|nr:hypothetical protein [Treponema sp.]